MAVTARAQVTFPMYTNVPEDVITNTLYFHNPASKPYGTIVTDETANLAAFYTTIYSAGLRANYVNWPAATVKWFDMADPQPRVPTIVPLGWTPAGSAGATDVPTEVSAVLSFQGAALSGQPQARRRGRIYLGGLGSSALSTSTTSAFPMISGAMLAAISNAATALRAAAFADGDDWSVWSQTDLQHVVITNGWVDNSPDTQRRRGILRTTRTLWT